VAPRNQVPQLAQKAVPGAFAVRHWGQITDWRMAASIGARRARRTSDRLGCARFGIGLTALLRRAYDRARID
jgi:hypothetical protein